MSGRRSRERRGPASTRETLKRESMGFSFHGTGRAHNPASPPPHRPPRRPAAQPRGGTHRAAPIRQDHGRALDPPPRLTPVLRPGGPHEPRPAGPAHDRTGWAPRSGGDRRNPAPPRPLPHPPRPGGSPANPGPVSPPGQRVAGSAPAVLGKPRRPGRNHHPGRLPATRAGRSGARAPLASGRLPTRLPRAG